MTLRRFWLRSSLQCVLALGLSVSALPAHAMTVLAVDLKQLVQTSELVLHGKVVAVTNRDRTKDGQGVWTEFTLEVIDAWKGDILLKSTRGKRQFSWAHPGGTRGDGYVVSVPGMPVFQVGEEVVVALEKTSVGHVICGGPQGKWSVRTDAAGKKTVLREMSDVQFLTRDPQTGSMAAGHAPAQSLRTLAELKADVLAAQTVPAGTPAPIPVHRVK